MLVQLVEIPGLIEGANDDRGGGRALLGVLRGADAIVLCQPAAAPHDALAVVRREVATAGIEKPTVVAATKLDEADGAAPARLAEATGLPVVGVSVLDEVSLDRLREAIWGLTGLLRVHLRHGAQVDEEPLALPVGATVADVADAIHHELGAGCTGGRVWGASARFPGQRVGRRHGVADGDVVEVLRR